MIVHLDKVIRAVCPIHGVSIGRKNDKITWRIDFTEEATLEQREEAQAVVDAFDVEAGESAIESKRLAKEALASTENRTLFENLSTEAEISDFVLQIFPDFTPQQQAVLRLLVHLAVIR